MSPGSAVIDRGESNGFPSPPREHSYITVELLLFEPEITICNVNILIVTLHCDNRVVSIYLSLEWIYIKFYKTNYYF